MDSIRKYAATGLVMGALLTATPALADTGKHAEGALKIGIGSFFKAFNHDRNDDHERSNDSRKALSGSLTAMSGNTLTVTTKEGTLYTVATAGATINGSTDVAAQLAKFQIGDKIQVQGSVSGATVTATKVRNTSLASREALTRFNGARVGTVAALGTNTITLDRFGTGTTTVLTSGPTFYVANGSATTSAAVNVGSKVFVFGPTSTSGSNDSITASVVLIIDSGVKFLKHMFGH